MVGDGGLGLGVRVRMRGVVTGGDGGLVLGVRVRMRAIFTTKAPLFHSKISWLGVAPNFSVFICDFRPAGCWAGPKLAKKH